ncbi:MAG: competence/damage-inducible protein A [Verrucomicrobiales bacterium]|nr:competence/damage-inducible protein A [Verrucomicrobiales bacterium]
MRIEVVNTGTELLLGKVVNTHAAYFGNELFKLGLRIQRQTTIPDGDEIRTVLNEAFPRCDVIVITGGLGPTNDDITREVVAEMLGRTLVLDQSILDGIREMFISRGLKPHQSNDRQAMVPEGGVVLDNPNGTAPGLYLPATESSPHLFLLPGPPRELKPMWEDLVIPKIKGFVGDDADSSQVFRNFRIYGSGESSIASYLEPKLDLIENLELGYCARLGEVDVRLIGTEKAIDEASAIIREKYHQKIVTESEDSIARVVIDLLIEKNQTLSTAESCTGGLIASTITDESGSSAVFHRGYVTYSNEVKSALLGVPGETLASFGAVSGETVRAMAEGCLRESGATHAVAVSGIAGPTGGSEEKPVGTVYIGVASRGEETFVKRYYWPAERVAFKTRVCRMVIDLVRQRILGFPLE